MKYYIETLTPKPAWLALSEEERAAYMNKTVLAAMPLVEQGAEIIAMGENDSDTLQRLNHHFFIIWKFPTDQLAKDFQGLALEDGWYDYFDQFNLKGSAVDLTEKLVNFK